MNHNYILHIKKINNLARITDDENAYYWEIVMQELKSIKNMLLFCHTTLNYKLHPFARLKLKAIKFYTPELFKSLKIAYDTDEQITQILKSP